MDDGTLLRDQTGLIEHFVISAIYDNIETKNEGRKMKKEEKKDILSKHRIEALFDGVFAIAMTILVLNISVPPDLKISNPDALLNALQKMTPTFFNYVISFIILASFWVNNNHQFRYIKQTDKTHLWLYLWNLMFIVLIPFSTSLMGDYSGLIFAELFFHLNLLIIGIISIITWHYIVKNHHLLQQDKYDILVIRKGRNKSLVFIIVPLIAICVTFWLPEWSTLSYVLIPFIASILR